MLPVDAGWAEEVRTTFPCVHFSELERFLPRSWAGFHKVREDASTGKYGEVSVSEAERVFAQEDDRELSVRIVDTTLKGKLARAIEALAEQPASSAPERGALFRLAHAVGYVRFEPSEGRAEANLLVDDRFIVSVTSRGLQGTGEVRRLANSLDLAGLSKLRSPTSKD